MKLQCVFAVRGKGAVEDDDEDLQELQDREGEVEDAAKEVDEVEDVVKEGAERSHRYTASMLANAQTN